MEIRSYFRIITRFWWVIVIAFLAAGIGSFLLTKIRTPQYEAIARVTLKQSSNITETNQIINLISLLTNRSIPGTYAQILTADQIQKAAQVQVGMTSDQALKYTTEANVLPDTFAIELRGDGPDPKLLADYLNATITEATSNADTNPFPVLQLAVVQPASMPDAPISPVPGRDIPLGAGLGLAVGILLALALDYLLGPAAVRTVEPNTEPQRGFLRPPMSKARQS